MHLVTDTLTDIIKHSLLLNLCLLTDHSYKVTMHFKAAPSEKLTRTSIPNKQLLELVQLSLLIVNFAWFLILR